MLDNQNKQFVSFPDSGSKSDGYISPLPEKSTVKNAQPNKRATKKNLDVFSSYPDVVTVSELMKMLHVGRNMAYDLLKNGEVKSFRIGRRYIIPKKYVISYIFSNC